jgi:hypothetical protein
MLDSIPSVRPARRRIFVAASGLPRAALFVDVVVDR